jgi:hypothetical protein
MCVSGKRFFGWARPEASAFNSRGPRSKSRTCNVSRRKSEIFVFEFHRREAGKERETGKKMRSRRELFVFVEDRRSFLF